MKIFAAYYVNTLETTTVASPPPFRHCAYIDILLPFLLCVFPQQLSGDLF